LLITCAYISCSALVLPESCLLITCAYISCSGLVLPESCLLITCAYVSCPSLSLVPHQDDLLYGNRFQLSQPLMSPFLCAVLIVIFHICPPSLYPVGFICSCSFPHLIAFCVFFLLLGHCYHSSSLKLMIKGGLCCRPVSVCLSVTLADSIHTAEDIIKLLVNRKS